MTPIRYKYFFLYMPYVPKAEIIIHRIGIITLKKTDIIPKSKKELITPITKTNRAIPANLSIPVNFRFIYKN